jgi:hypothetical protein
VRQSPASKNVDMKAEDTVEIHHQAMTGDDTDWEDIVRAAVNCRVCELGTLYLLVVTICMRSINPIINPNPIYSHSKIMRTAAFLLGLFFNHEDGDNMFFRKSGFLWITWCYKLDTKNPDKMLQIVHMKTLCILV